MAQIDMLERGQVLLYAMVIGAEIALGTAVPRTGDFAAAGILPVLTILLYATFLPVHVCALPGALRDRRFLGATLAGNSR